MALRPASLSLPTRLALATMVVTALVMAVVIVLLQSFLSRQTTNSAVDVGQGRADAMAGVVRIDATGRPSVAEPQGTDPLDADVWVFDLQGRLVDGKPPSAEVIAFARGDLSHAEVSDHELVRAHAPASVVVAAVDLAPYEAAERRGLTASIALALLTVAASGLAAAQAAKLSLARVWEMARAAADWEEHQPGRRFALGPGSDEIHLLGRTLDQMLDRLEQALHSERRLSDEVAHELRTPLTVIRAEAELALASAEGEARESLDRILEAATRVEAAISAMLAAARSRQEASACDAVATLAALVRDRRRTTDSAGPEVVGPTGAAVDVAVAPEVLTAAVTPLLDNAARHAHGRVWVLVARREDHVVVSVCDDGPGVPTQDVEAVFEPGRRGALPGSAGLGLSVVRRLAASVGGTVAACPGPGGRFELVLPAA